MNRYPFNSTILLSVVLLLAPVLTVAQHQILPDFQADPSARVFNGRLYIYPSHDLAGNKDWEMFDWHVFSTDDMVHWKDHGVIFSLKDITWAKYTRGRPTVSSEMENTTFTSLPTIRLESLSQIRLRGRSRTRSASP